MRAKMSSNSNKRNLVGLAVLLWLLSACAAENRTLGTPSTDGDDDELDGGSSADLDTDADTDTDTDGLGESIEVVITADNAYGFGYGSETEMLSYYGGIVNSTAGEIFNCVAGPETYDIDPSEAASAEYLYIVAWADTGVTQGVIGQFRRVGGVGGFGELVYTGDEGFEVCATGQNFIPGDGSPSGTLINEKIALCNEGGTMDPETTSMGWVGVQGTEYGALAVGEDNTTAYSGTAPSVGNEFGVVCQEVMDEEARWMWFNWDPANLVAPDASPFMWPDVETDVEPGDEILPDGGLNPDLIPNPDHEFLIFRLAAEALPPIE